MTTDWIIEGQADTKRSDNDVLDAMYMLGLLPETTSLSVAICKPLKSKVFGTQQGTMGQFTKGEPYHKLGEGPGPASVGRAVNGRFATSIACQVD